MPQALDYRNRITAAIPAGSSFNPLMTLYLTDSTSPEVTWALVHRAASAVGAFNVCVYAIVLVIRTSTTKPVCRQDIRAAKEAGVVAFKLYPAGATTNSDSGVTDIQRVIPTLHAMAEVSRRFPCYIRLRTAQLLLAARRHPLHRLAVIQHLCMELSRQTTSQCCVCSLLVMCAGRGAVAGAWRGDRPCG